MIYVGARQIFYKQFIYLLAHNTSFKNRLNRIKSKIAVNQKIFNPTNINTPFIEINLQVKKR